MRSHQDILESRMQGNLARLVWGWGPGETPGPTPPFLGSEAGGEVAARLYTLTTSDHRHHLNLWAYVDDVLRRLADGDADLNALVPDAWAKQHLDKVRTYREAESLARAAKTKAHRALRRKLAGK
ncbi:hypothetical protein [Rubripirellula obstinata]|nr:hypothetical protein [Rubripirellula obstinata]